MSSVRKILCCGLIVVCFFQFSFGWNLQSQLLFQEKGQLLAASSVFVEPPKLEGKEVLPKNFHLARHSQQGSTLTDLLVYVGLMVFLISVLPYIFYQFSQVFSLMIHHLNVRKEVFFLPMVTSLIVAVVPYRSNEEEEQVQLSFFKKMLVPVVFILAPLFIIPLTVVVLVFNSLTMIDLQQFAVVKMFQDFPWRMWTLFFIFFSIFLVTPMSSLTLQVFCLSLICSSIVGMVVQSSKRGQLVAKVVSVGGIFVSGFSQLIACSFFLTHSIEEGIYLMLGTFTVGILALCSDSKFATVFFISASIFTMGFWMVVFNMLLGKPLYHFPSDLFAGMLFNYLLIFFATRKPKEEVESSVAKQPLVAQMASPLAFARSL